MRFLDGGYTKLELDIVGLYVNALRFPPSIRELTVSDLVALPSWERRP